MKAIALALLGIGLVGCNVGVTPAGGSGEEVKAAFDKLPLEKRVKLTMGSPMPQDQKIKRIKEMYEKEGKPLPADIQNMASGPGFKTSG